MVSLTPVPCASATFTVWSSAWLAGAAAPDDVLDALGPWGQLHDVVTTDADTARTHSLSAPGAPPGSVTFLLAALRRAAPRGPGRVVLPAPGDPRGLPGPGPFSRAAMAAGEGVLFTDAGLGIVPGTAADGVLRWTVHPVPDPGPAPEHVALPQAERDLRDQVRQSASVLTSLGVARHRPGVREEIAAKLRARPAPCGPPACPPPRCASSSTPTRSRRSSPPRPWTSPAARSPRPPLPPAARPCARWRPPCASPAAPP